MLFVSLRLELPKGLFGHFEQGDRLSYFRKAPFLFFTIQCDSVRLGHRTRMCAWLESGGNVG